MIQGNIEKLSVKQLEAYKADLWLLAPPCQPYTRRGLQKDADDWRASSFMTLLLKLPQMQVTRKHILLLKKTHFFAWRYNLLLSWQCGWCTQHLDSAQVPCYERQFAVRKACWKCSQQDSPSTQPFLGTLFTSITASCVKSLVRKQHLHFMQLGCCYPAGTITQSRHQARQLLLCTCCTS